VFQLSLQTVFLMGVCPKIWRPLCGVGRLRLTDWLGWIALAWGSGVACIAGCGTTRWSDTSRTATEQMLLSDAIDRAISQIDVSMLAGHSIFIDNKFIAGEVDEKYIVSTLRQHMMASGCTIKDKPEDAMCVLEIRSGAVGTNRSDLLFGVPATSLPTGGMLTGIPSTIPEIPLVKRTSQQGVCKIAVFAYDRGSGRPLWQSGTRQVASQTKDIWIFGAGPFTRGTIHDGTHLAGERLAKKKPRGKDDSVWVAHEILFPEPPRSAQGLAQGPPPGVNQAVMNVPVTGPVGTNGPVPASGAGAMFAAPAGPPISGGPTTTGSGTATSNSATTGSGTANSGSATTSSANPVAGAVGAMDWAQTMLENGRANPSSPATQTQSAPGQTPAVLRLKGL
jgi:hypothetical protein